MKNNTWNWIILLAVAIAATWYLSSSTSAVVGIQPSVITTPQGTPSGTAAKTTGGAKVNPSAPAPVGKPSIAKMQGIGTVAFLSTFREPLICTITTTGISKRTASLYLTDGKFRVNFATASVISDGLYLYTWKSGALTGLKLLAGSSVSGSVIASNGGFDPGSDLSFACAKWAENDSLLVPPASVSFSNTL
jgi:hypothetical protein